MDLREMELFLQLSDSLSFTRTAEQRHMSLSAVSRTVQRMESELGCRLFERDQRSVRLSEAGRRFESYARQAVSDWQRVSGELKQSSADLRGQVSVYCSVTASYSVLSPVLERFRAEQPAIDIMLHTGDQAEAVNRIHHGLEDVAIAARPDQLPGRLEFLTLLHSPLVLIAPTFDCSINEGLAGNLEAGIAASPFILAERGLSKQRVEAWFREAGRRPRIYAQVAGHEAIAAMVALGLGIGAVPRVVLDNFTYRDRLRVLPVEPALGPFPVGVCADRQRLENPLVSAFWDAARRAYPEQDAMIGQ